MTAAMELLYLVAFFLLTRPGVTFGDNNKQRVVVKEGSDVVLPCSINDTPLNYELFDWKKGQKEVFLYDAGIHYNNGLGGQDPQFKGRVSHFEDELKNGNASIKISDIKLEDSGDYSCIFPHLQNPKIHIMLIVDPVLKKRNKPGAAPKPYVRTLDQTADRALLECAVKGAFPKPRVEWKDSAGKVLHSVVTYENEVSERFDIIFQTRVTQTGYYSCVVTQYDIGHQVYTETFVLIGASSKPYITILDETKDWSLLQCEVHGALSKPVVQWQDSSGNIVPAKEPQVTEREGRYDIILQTTVTKTDRYRCVATQEEIKHHVYSETEVYISGSQSPGWGWLILAFVFGGVITALSVAALWIWLFLRKRRPDATSVDGVFVEEGSDAVLPCSRGNQDLTGSVFEWKKGEQKVFLYAEDKIENGGPLGQDQQFRGRVSHFGGQLQHGNASIKIRNTKVEDSGIYTCHFPRLDPPQTVSVKLIVGPSDNRVFVKEGSDVVLPCSPGKQDLTKRVFIWKKGEQKVFLYDAGKIDNGGPLGQHQQFRGHVSHFGGQLQHGNASIKIRNTKVQDSGIYTCHFPYLDPPQTVSVKLVVATSVIRAEEGSDAELSCSPGKLDLTRKVFIWNKGKQKVFLYAEDKIDNGGPLGQDQQFRDRVSLSEGQLQHGKASITIHNTKVEDSGIYTCHFPYLDPLQTYYVKLIVGSAGSKVDDEAVPLSTKGNLDLTKRVFIWKKGEQNVFLYAEGKIENGGPLGQHQQFRGRVSHFGGQLHLGKATIKIHKTKVEDSGIYACEFRHLDPPLTFSVKLVVDSADSEADSKVDDEAVPLSTKGPSDVRVVRVEEGSDAVLPCVLGSHDQTGKAYKWKNEGSECAFEC